MTSPTGLFNFQTASNPNSDAANMQQYLLQGQMGTAPGQTQIAKSDPIANVAQAGFGQTLASIIAQQLNPHEPAQSPQQFSPMLQQAQQQNPNSTQNQLANLLSPQNQFQGITY